MNDSPLTTQRFEDYVRHHKREHELIEHAQDAAKVASDLRLDRLNELRQEVERDREMFVARESHDIRMTQLEERLRYTENQLAARNSSLVTWVIAIGIIFTILQAALRFAG